MKRQILLVVSVCALSLFASAQTPNNHPQSNAKTTEEFLGVIKPDLGIQLPGFRGDTAYLNTLPFLKGIPGLLVRLGNDVYMRDSTASKWLLKAGSGTLLNVGLIVPSAFHVSGSPLTGSGGNITIIGAGSTSQYVNGAGGLTSFPTIPAQFNLITGYGIRPFGSYPNITIAIDSFNYRKQDTTYSINDSAIGFEINGHPYVINVRGGNHGGGAGVGSVTHVGDLQPLFSTANPTSTPTFTFNTVSPHNLLGRNTGSGDPSWLPSIDSSFMGTGFHTQNYFDLRYAFRSRLISTGFGLSGGGDLTADRTHIADTTSSGLSSYYLRRKDSATGTNPTGYLTASSVGTYLSGVDTIYKNGTGDSLIQIHQTRRTALKFPFSIADTTIFGIHTTGFYDNRYIQNQFSVFQQAYYAIQGHVAICGDLNPQSTHPAVLGGLAPLTAVLQVVGNHDNRELSLQRSSQGYSDAVVLEFFINRYRNMDTLKASWGSIGKLIFSGAAGDSATISYPLEVVSSITKTAPSYLNANWLVQQIDTIGTVHNSLLISPDNSLIVNGGGTTSIPYRLGVFTDATSGRTGSVYIQDSLGVDGNVRVGGSSFFNSKIFIGGASGVNSQDIFQVTAPTTGNVTKGAMLNGFSGITDGTKFWKGPVSSVSKIFEPSDGFPSASSNAFTPGAEAAYGLGWILPKGNYTINGGIDNNNTNIVGNIQIGGLVDSVNITLGTSLENGLSNFAAHTDLAPGSSQFGNVVGVITNYLSIFKATRKTTSTIDHLAHFGAASPGGTLTNGQIIKLITGFEVADQSSAAVWRPYAFLDKSSNNLNGFLGRVFIKDTTPSNNTYNAWLFNSGTSYLKDTTFIKTMATTDSSDAAASTKLVHQLIAGLSGGGGSVTPAALTKTDDTNVTLTLGGTPATALLQATSLTLGWTGTLADGRIASAATWNAKLTSALTNGNFWVGNGSNVATSVTPTGDVTFSNAGVFAIGSNKVTNTMLAGSIAASKLIGTDIATVGTVTTGTWHGTAIGAIYGGTGLTSYTTGDLPFASATNTLSKLGAGTNGYVLTMVSGVPAWAVTSGGTGPDTTVVIPPFFSLPGSSSSVPDTIGGYVWNPTVHDTGFVTTAQMNLKLNISDTSSAFSHFIVSAGSLSPLFTTSVTSRNLAFSLSNAAAHTFLGNSTGSSATPTYTKVDLSADITGVNPIVNGGTNNSSLSVTAGTVYYGDGTKLIGLPPGTANQILHGGTTPSWKDTTVVTAGTVTSVGVTDGNGFDFTITTASPNPVISLTTTIADTRVLYSNSGALTSDANFNYSSSVLHVGVASGGSSTDVMALGGSLRFPFATSSQAFGLSPTSGNSQTITGTDANTWSTQLNGFGFWNTTTATASGGRFYVNGAKGGVIGNPSSAATMTSIDSINRVGIATLNPTAWLTLPAGTAGSGRSPLKFVSGTNLTTPEDGAVEYNGTHFYITIGSTRYQLDQQSGSGSLTGFTTFGSTPNANGGSVSGANIILQPADGSNPGGVSTTTQTFAGVKTFSSQITGSISGNAGTSTALATPRALNGINFDGSAAITVPIPLSRTTVKSANYSAVAGDLIPCDNTGGSFTVTLPTAPTDRTLVCVKLVLQTGSNTISIATGGSDVLNKAGGSTSYSISLLNESVLLQYNTTASVWTILSDDIPTSNVTSAYSSSSQINNYSYSLNKLNGTKDTFSFNLGAILSWQSITATTKTMVAGEGYVSTSTGGTQLVYTLPTTASVGQVFAVTGAGSGGWKIAQNASQVIKQSGNTTTTGTGGYIASGTQYDAVEIICVVSNTTFLVRTSSGTLTLN